MALMCSESLHWKIGRNNQPLFATLGQPNPSAARQHEFGPTCISRYNACWGLNVASAQFLELHQTIVSPIPQLDVRTESQ